MWPERKSPGHVDLPIHAVSPKEGENVLDPADCEVSFSITCFTACPLWEYQSVRTLVPSETRFVNLQ